MRVFSDGIDGALSITFPHRIHLLLENQSVQEDVIMRSFRRASSILKLEAGCFQCWHSWSCCWSQQSHCGPPSWTVDGHLHQSQRSQAWMLVLWRSHDQSSYVSSSQSSLGRLVASLAHCGSLRISRSSLRQWGRVHSPEVWDKCSLIRLCLRCLMSLTSHFWEICRVPNCSSSYSMNDFFRNLLPVLAKWDDRLCQHCRPESWTELVWNIWVREISLYCIAFGRKMCKWLMCVKVLDLADFILIKVKF